MVGVGLVAARVELGAPDGCGARAVLPSVAVTAFFKVSNNPINLDGSRVKSCHVYTGRFHRLQPRQQVIGSFGVGLKMTFRL